MKLVKIFGIVMAAHGVAFMFIFAIPGCRSTGKKPVAQAPAIATETSPLSASEPMTSPESMNSPDSFYGSSDVSPVRFSPTRPGTQAASQVIAESAPSTTNHTVVKGDNLWSIARKNGITVKQLTAANKLRADTPLKLGQVLVIPGKAAASNASAPATKAASSAPAPAPTTTVTHVVKSGETLGGIARRYQVKIGDVATANNIADPTKLRVGQSLKIPGSRTPAPVKTATPAARPAPAPSNPAPALAPAAPGPLPSVFESPVAPAAPAPVPAVEESPFVSPAPENSDAPMIRVEESGAPRIE